MNDDKGLVERLQHASRFGDNADAVEVLEEAAARIQGLSDRIAVLEGTLRDIANALPISPMESLSMWRSLANACQKTARDALTPQESSINAE